MRRALGAAILFGSVVASSVARADAETCVAASDEGQKLRDEGHFGAARVELAACAHEDCPSPVRTDCLRWLDDVDKRTPTIVIAATANGKDTTDVRVTIDGAVVAKRLDGNALPLDPGEHTLRYEHVGAPPVEEKIVLREGEKDRALRVELGPPPPLHVLPRPLTLAYTMTGVALGGAVGFGVFGAIAFALVEGCPQGSCADVSSRRVATPALTVAADVSLAVALISAGIATWAFVRHGHGAASKPAAGARFDVVRGAILF